MTQPIYQLSQEKRKRFSIVLLVGQLLAFLLLAGCSSVPGLSGPPQEVKDKITANVVEASGVVNEQSKDYNFTCTKQLDISTADKANGVSEKLCVKVEYLSRAAFGSNPPWRDSALSYEAANVNGEWIVEFRPFCGCED